MVRVIIVLILIDLFVRSSASHTIIDLYASDYGVTHKEPLKLILNQSFTIYVHSNKYALEIRCYDKERGVIIDSLLRLKNNCYVSDKKTIVTAAMDGIWNCTLYYNSHGLSTSSQLQPDYKLFKLEAKVIVLQTYNDMSKVPNTATVKNQNDDNTTLSKKEEYSNKEMEMYITTNRPQSERESPSKSFWYIISALIIVVLAVIIAVTIIEVRKKINARKVNLDNNDNFGDHIYESIVYSSCRNLFKEEKIRDVDVSTIVSRPPLPLPSEMCEDNESVQYTTVYGRGTPGWS